MIDSTYLHKNRRIFMYFTKLKCVYSLLEAKKIVCGQRRKCYGPKFGNGANANGIL